MMIKLLIIDISFVNTRPILKKKVPYVMFIFVCLVFGSVDILIMSNVCLKEKNTISENDWQIQCESPISCSTQTWFVTYACWSTSTVKFR